MLRCMGNLRRMWEWTRLLVVARHVKFRILGEADFSENNNQLSIDMLIVFHLPLFFDTLHNPSSWGRMGGSETEKKEILKGVRSGRKGHKRTMLSRGTVGIDETERIRKEIERSLLCQTQPITKHAYDRWRNTLHNTIYKLFITVVITQLSRTQQQQHEYED